MRCAACPLAGRHRSRRPATRDPGAAHRAEAILSAFGRPAGVRTDEPQRHADSNRERAFAGSAGQPRQSHLVAFFALGLLVLLIGAATAAGATVIRGAQHDAEAAGEALVQVVINEKRIVPELGARGGNRGELEELLAAVDSSSGLERSYRALAYTNAVQAQIVAIGDVRNTPIQRRQHEIDLAQDHFEGALAAWSSSAGNPLGRLAVTFGLADGPPAR